MKKLLTALLFTFAFCVQANAASKFLVLCTTACTWDNTNDAIWSTASGGANNTTHPVAGDAVTLDASSCVGGLTCTITVAANLAMTSLTFGACTASTTGCIIDFSANNNNITLTGAVTGSGVGTRTLNMGNGTWSISTTATMWNFTTTTNLTFAANSSQLTLIPSALTVSSTFIGGGLTYNNASFAPASAMSTMFAITGNNSFANLTFTNTQYIRLPAGGTQTVSGTLTFDGTSSAKALLIADGAGSATISVGGANTLNWLGLQRITASGAGSITANSSTDFGGNSNVTINAPASGGGFIIGGG